MPESYKKETEASEASPTASTPWICDNCDRASACFMRADEVSILWIFEDQLEHCLEEGKPSYEDDDFWMVKEVQSE